MATFPSDNADRGPRTTFSRRAAAQRTHAARTDTPRSGRRPTPIWLPWLMAPLFMLMPMGGCMVAGRLRQSAARTADLPPVAPIGTVVTADHD